VVVGRGYNEYGPYYGLWAEVYDPATNQWAEVAKPCASPGLDDLASTVVTRTQLSPATQLRLRYASMERLMEENLAASLARRAREEAASAVGSFHALRLEPEGEGEGSGED